MLMMLMMLGRVLRGSTWASSKVRRGGGIDSRWGGYLPWGAHVIWLLLVV